MPSSKRSDMSAAAERARLLIVGGTGTRAQAPSLALADEYQLLMTACFEQALAICREDPPDLVLLDVASSTAAGLDLCRRIRSEPRTRDIPLILITAHANAPEGAEGLALGAADVIPEPLDAAVMRARVKTHIALARSAAHLAATLEATPDGVLITDLRGAISGFSQRFAQQWQLPESLDPRTDGAAILATMRAALAPGQICPLETGSCQDSTAPQPQRTLELRDGRHLECRMALLRSNARPTGRLYSFRDVTQRRHAEQALAELNASLEHRIQERMRELQAARFAADAANRAKSEFLSNMSHEIRTPLHALLGLLQLALKTDPSPKLGGYLDKMRLAGQHLLGIVNDILDFSMIEAGALDIAHAEFLPAELVRELVGALREGAMHKGLELEIDIDPDLMQPVMGDAARLSQVLRNLLSNAIKFSAAGRIAVRARASDRQSGPALVRFEVEDQGIGMNAAQVSQLFQAFHQIDTSVTRRHGGTGLGLVIAQRLVEAMGGTLGVDSQPGQGSRFWFTVSLTKARARNASEREPRPEGRRLAGRNILVVDDNLFNQQVASEALLHEGAEVTLAANGQEALDAIEHRAFDLVLMDVQMPVMDGLEATRRIRARPDRAGLRVVGQTTNARRDDIDRCLASGMEEVLVKPVAPEHLYEVVQRWLPPAQVAKPLANVATVPTPAPQPSTGQAPWATACDPAVIDLSVLASTLQQREPMVRKFARMFVESTVQAMRELEAALAAGNLTVVGGLGHRTKSAAATVGAMGFAHLCDALQECRRSGDLDKARAIVAQMRPLLARIEERVAQAFGVPAAAEAPGLSAAGPVLPGARAAAAPASAGTARWKTRS